LNQARLIILIIIAEYIYTENQYKSAKKERDKDNRNFLIY